MKLILMFSVFALLYFQPSVAFADHGTSKNENIDGGRIESRAFKRNWFVYKDIGSKVKVKSDEKKRRWWCGWLCKTRKAIKVSSIEITNTYYADVDPGPAEVLFGSSRTKTCRDTNKCSLREWAVGIAPKFSFDGTPTGSDGVPFPLKGVIGRHVVVLEGGRSITVFVSKGPHL